MKFIAKTSAIVAAITLASHANAGLEGKIGDTEWKIGGFIELENYYSDKAGSDATYTMRANRSRFNLKTATDTPEGKARTYLEFDFNGKTTDNDVEPRLRHAAIFWNGWTFGQTLSIFHNIEAYHKSVNDLMPAPIVGLSSNPLDRNPQIAYGQKLGDGYSFKVGIEKPKKDASTTRPFLAGRLAYNNKGAFAWSLSAASYEDAAGDDQFRVLAGARYKTGPFSFRLGHQYDDGIDGNSTSGSVRYNFDRKNWVSAIYEAADVNGVDKDRGYLNYYHQLTKTVQVGFEYEKRGISGDNTEEDILRVDFKKTF